MAIRFRDIWQDLRDTAGRVAERTHTSAFEAALTDPGLQALAVYRAASWLHGQGLGTWARMISQHVRRFTGITIDPTARIGRRCVFGVGPVIVGESAVIGDDCMIEAGAMLIGGPRLGSAVVVEAGAIVRGEVFLGNDVRVLAGAVVDRDIPDGGVAVGVPGRVLARAQAKADPDARAVQALAERLYHLEEQLQILAFATRQQAGADRLRTRNPDQYGPIPAVEALIDGAGI
jgi:serine O-acetyltransferase